MLFSIHALREEGDTINQLRQAFQVQFLSTPLREEGDAFRDSSTITKHISIHALREEGDSKKQRQNLYFLINYTTFCTNLEEPLIYNGSKNYPNHAK